MFELTVALKYLIPKKRSLSTALIAAMSVLVISLVVWLVLVFLSVTAGIEKNWLKKLTSLHAPLRIAPTPHYYRSYYYLVDTAAAASRYLPKTIGEKRETQFTDPYSVEFDAELPADWPAPDRLTNGELADPVKTLYTVLESTGLPFQDYEMGGALLKLHLHQSNTSLSQMSFLLSLGEKNPELASLLLPSDSPSLPSVSIDQAGHIKLPDLGAEVPILIAKTYRDNGAKQGDRGSLNFSALSGAFSSEQRIPVRVVGFYDPGFLSAASKCILVPSSVTRLIHASTQTFSPDGTPTNGIFVWTDQYTDAEKVREKINRMLKEKGIDAYWNVSTYEEFEFSKDIMLQFKSDRLLFILIASIILIVACCNIISLLVLLVNDKKKEIAILQAMGASFSSIAAIFGFCGFLMGTLSCLFGSLVAYLTIKKIHLLISLLSSIQGHSPFNPAFFGQSLSNTLSHEALIFVLIATPILSLLAGLIPAIKASRIRPSTVLRSE